MISDRVLRWSTILLLTASLLVGAFLLWESFQSYAVVSHIADSFASDGKLESFTFARYTAIQLPFRVVGLLLLTGFGLGTIFWKSTKKSVSRSFEWSSLTFKHLGMDTKYFLEDISWRVQSRLDKTCLVGLTILAILPRVSVMNTLFLHDESYTYIAFASGTLWHTVSDYHLPNNHVFFSVILNLTARIFGDQQWALRIPTVVMGVLMVPVMYFVARKLYNRETAILSSALIAFFPEFIQRSTSARGYILLALIGLMLLGLAAYVRTKKNLFAWLMLTVLSAVGFFTIPIMIYPFGGIFLWLFLSGVLMDMGPDYKNRWDFFKLWFLSGIGASILTVILYSPILLSDAESLLNNKFVAPLSSSTFLSIIKGRLINTWNLWMDAIPNWLVYLLVVGLVIGLLFHRKYANHKIPTQVAFVAWVALVILILKRDTEPRMWSIMLAFLLLWCAVGIAVLLQWLTSGASVSLRQSVLAATMMGALLVQNVLVIPAIPGNWSKVTQVERIAAYFSDRLTESDRVVISAAEEPILEYQFDVNGLSSEYFLRDKAYQHAYIVVLSSSETLEDVVDHFGPSDPKLDANSIKFSEQFGNYQIYEAGPMQ